MPRSMPSASKAPRNSSKLFEAHPMLVDEKGKQ
jgi:hypothetical protein